MGEKSSSKLVWLGFFGMLLLLALLASFALLKGGRQLARVEAEQQSGAVQKLFYIILDGEQRVIPESKRLRLSLDMQSAVDEEQQLLRQRLQQRLESAVDMAFAPVHAHVSDFADWYYSLTGEYMRYAHALGGDMSEYLQQRLRETVFLPAALESNIDNLLLESNAALIQELQQSGARLAAQLQLVVAAASWPVGSGQPLIGESLDLDRLFAAGLQLNASDINRQVLATLTATGTGVAVAKGLGAAVVKKTVAKVAGTKSFHLASALLAKLAAKSAIKGGGALAGAGAGAAICSPSGPGALVCGAVGGLIAWIAVDKAVIELDEALNRETFEDEIHAAIAEQQEQLKSSLLQAHEHILSAGLAPIKQGAQALAVPAGEFTPVDTALNPAARSDYEK